MRDGVDIRLGGVDYSLLPTWQAYSDIEARTGKSLRSLWIALLTSQLELRSMAVIVCAGMRASDASRNIGEDAAARAIFDEGTWWDLEDGIGRRILDYLEALGWTPDQRGKIKAEAAKMANMAPSADSSPIAQAQTDLDGLRLSSGA